MHNQVANKGPTRELVPPLAQPAVIRSRVLVGSRDGLHGY
jgi:hypothetical protein